MSFDADGRIGLDLIDLPFVKDARDPAAAGLAVRKTRFRIGQRITRKFLWLPASVGSLN